MSNPGPEGPIAVIVGLIIVFLIFDAFFCGCFFFDQAIFDALQEAAR